MPTEHASAADKALKTRSRIGVLIRTGANELDITDARRDHAAAALEKRVLEVLATAPPLSAAQRSHLASLFAVED